MKAAHLSREESELNGQAAGRTNGEAQCGPLSILVVNNMPDAALRATERHYCSMLAAASAGMLVDLRFTSLLGTPRQGAAWDHVNRFYEDPSLMAVNLPDGLIVTGTEPRGLHMTEEPLWQELRQLIDWVERCSIPAIWSCLAAHAAVYRFDGIERTPLKHKLSGVFTCKVETFRHRLVQGGSKIWRVPHSRMNGLCRRTLEANGYSILSSSGKVGVDAFVKQDGAMQLFFQGHPEYGPDTLLAEHRRDVARAIESQQEKRPPAPVGLTPKIQMRGGSKLSLGSAGTGISNGTPESAFAGAGYHEHASEWSGTARILYSNWLSYLEERRSTAQRYNAFAVTNFEGRTGATHHPA